MRFATVGMNGRHCLQNVVQDVCLCASGTSCPLPPKVTSVHQPLDAANVSSLQRGQIRRLIQNFLGLLPE